MKFNDRDEFGRLVDIPSIYKVPFVELEEHERSEQDRQVSGAMNPTLLARFGGNARVRNNNNRQLYIVSFKCSRVEIFYLLENTGLTVKEGDIVIVEADRGQDLGTVQHAKVTHEEARSYKKKYDIEQYKWLMMFSKNNNQGSINPNAQTHGENQESNSRANVLANAPQTMQGNPRDQRQTPKAIKRLAGAHEIRALADKEANEAKAKRTCQQKAAQLRSDMEILDAEWQWDFQKLIFYFYADHYVDFKAVVGELYRIYKTRIWMSAINPASFAADRAHGQPPSGIGPGAVVDNRNNGDYSMAADPDPYGAQMPYRIAPRNQEYYNPLYQTFPGMPAGFGPNVMPMGGAYSHSSTVSSMNDPTPTLYQPGPYGTAESRATQQDPHPSVPPYIHRPTGTFQDYNFYYDRSPGNGQVINPDLFTPFIPYSQSGHMTAANPRALPPPTNPTQGGNPFGPMVGTQSRYPGFQQAPIGTRPASGGVDGQGRENGPRQTNNGNFGGFGLGGRFEKK